VNSRWQSNSVLTYLRRLEVWSRPKTLTKSKS
jgi:hypothetical protein